jgi:hypothetical protein
VQTSLYQGRSSFSISAFSNSYTHGDFTLTQTRGEQARPIPAGLWTRIGALPCQQKNGTFVPPEWAPPDDADNAFLHQNRTFCAKWAGYEAKMHEMEPFSHCWSHYDAFSV